MRMFIQVLECPSCKDECEHRVLSYGDGTAVAWCGSCHNPHELLVTQLRPRRGGSASTIRPAPAV
jgi:transcription elongation factor Elf1